jgi:hypothetical protein
MPDDKVLLYSPDDEPLSQGFNGVTFELSPNASTEVTSPWPKKFSAEQIADFLISKLGMWGVCRVTGHVRDCKARHRSDQATVDAAEERYLRSTYDWAVQQIIDHNKAMAPRRQAGLPEPPVPGDVKTARAWLAAKRERLEKRGLVETA